MWILRPRTSDFRSGLSLRNFRLDTFVWEISFKSCCLQCFVWKLLLGIFRSFRMGYFARNLRLPTFAWRRSLGIFDCELRSDLSFGSFRSETFACDFRLELSRGNFSLGTFAEEPRMQARARGTSGSGLLSRVCKIPSENPSR